LKKRLNDRGNRKYDKYLRRNLERGKKRLKINSGSSKNMSRNYWIDVKKRSRKIRKKRLIGNKKL
jgi:hypothetical protein